MSQSQTNDKPVVLPTPEKMSLVRRGINFAKSPKGKVTLAVIALGALVGAGALAGRNANSTEEDAESTNVEDETTVA